MDLFAQQHRFSFHEGYSEGNPYKACYRASGAEISFLLEGAVEFVVDGQPRCIAAPALTCQTYDYELDVMPALGRRTRTVWCHFPTDRLTASDRTFLRHLPTSIPVEDSLVAMFRGATPLLSPREEITAGRGVPDVDDGMRMVRQGLGTAIFAEYIRCTSPARGVKDKLPIAVRLVRQVIEESYGRPWDLEGLASVAQLNAKYLITLFKRHLGETPISYLWHIRTQAGISMLRQTRLTVEQIAFECGYQSAAHFSRSVKQHCGRSPRALRHEM